MKVFILGGGGREHALGWKLDRSPHVKNLFFLPGNAGTAGLGRNLQGSPNDKDNVVAAARELRPDLVVVGPEAPLFRGVSDRLSEEGFRVFGPSSKAALIERDKGYAKDFLSRYKIPTSPYKIFSDPAPAHHYIEGKDSPLVVKASGPASGKGVIVCSTPAEAMAAVDEILVERKFGVSGERIVIEERLEGEELSLHLLTDGKGVVSFPPSQDHKPLGDGDTGPNTGGMGAYSPLPLIDPELEQRIEKDIVAPVLEGLKKDGIIYRGLLYIGLMITKSGPKVLEFNCRFGDPEAQPLMLLTDEDIFPLLSDTACSGLLNRKVKVRDGCALCVVAASKGYPASYEKGNPVKLDVAGDENLACFHAGTAEEDGRLVTSAGRVLGVTAFGSSLAEAKESAYAPLLDARIDFEGIYYRRDIGDKGLRRLAHEL